MGEILVFYVPPPTTAWFLEIAVIQHGAWSQVLGAGCCKVQTDVPTSFGRDSVFVIYSAAVANFPFPFHDPSVRYIIANYEQAAADHTHTPFFIERLRRAVAVWEYSISNMDMWKARYGIQARFVPLGYHADLQNLVRPPLGAQIYAPKVDVLFYGTQHPRRTALLDKLRAARLTVKECSNVFGAHLWSLVPFVSVIVNIHFYQPSILELARILPAVAAGKLVISERSDDAILDRMYAPLVVFADSDSEFIQLCCRFCADRELRELRVKQHTLALHTRFLQTTVLCDFKDRVLRQE